MERIIMVQGTYQNKDTKITCCGHEIKDLIPLLEASGFTCEYDEGSNPYLAWGGNGGSWEQDRSITINGYHRIAIENALLDAGFSVFNRTRR
jgi:hypothetical protein